MKPLVIGEGRTTLRYEIQRRGRDISVHIDGGASHLGSVSMAEGEALQTLSFPGHEESRLTEPLAKKLAAVFPCRIIVSGGVHLDDITKEEIRRILQQNEAAASELIIRLQNEE